MPVRASLAAAVAAALACTTLALTSIAHASPLTLRPARVQGSAIAFSVRGLAEDQVRRAYVNIGGHRVSVAVGHVRWAITHRRMLWVRLRSHGLHGARLVIVKRPATGSTTSVASFLGLGGLSMVVNRNTQVEKAHARPAIASSYETSGYRPAYMALDGSQATRWASAQGSDNEWWQVDLGAVRPIDQVQVDWETAYASHYQVLTSSDGSTFSRAADMYLSSAGTHTTSFTSRSARFVRIQGITRATQWGYSFYEARVYGSPDGISPPYDTTPPATTITGGPASGSSTTSTSASFPFESSEAGSVFQCQLDGGAWSSCSSPATYSSLATGAHSFSVRATDPSGNVDLTPATTNWTIAVPPVEKAHARPAIASSYESSPGFQAPYLAVDGSSSTRWASVQGSDNEWWQVDLGAARPLNQVQVDWEAAYASHYQILTSSDGSTFSDAADVYPSSAGTQTTTFPTQTARYVRLQGIARATQWGYSFYEVRVYGPADGLNPAYDTTPPHTTITGGPASGSSSTSTGASFTFASTEGGSVFQCQLDGGTWSGCFSPTTYSSLPTGTHTFAVRAVDPSGNVDPNPATTSWTIGTPPPSPPSCTPAFGSFAVGNWPAGCWRPYGSSSPFNQPLPASPRLYSNSAAVVSRTLRFGTPGNMVAGNADTSGDYAHPSYYSRTSDPWFKIHCTEPWGTCPIEGMWVQIPDAARPAGGADGHMAVIDQPDGWEYDFWQVQHKPGGGGEIDISWGGRTSTSGDGLGSNATAAQFGLQAGIIRAQEMEAGKINHALFMTVSCTTGGYVYPARGGGSTCSDTTNAPAGGMRFQLNYSDAEIAALNVPQWKKTILTALAHYGAYIGDTGGSGIGFEFESGSTYTSFGYQDEMVKFAQSQSGVAYYNGLYVFHVADGVDWTRFRVIDPCVSQGTC